MKKVNLNFNIKDLDGKEILDEMTGKEIHLGKMFAGALMREVDGDPVKYFEWAQSFNKGKEVTVDTSDFNTLKALARSVRSLTILCKAQIINYLETIK